MPHKVNKIKSFWASLAQIEVEKSGMSRYYYE